MTYRPNQNCVTWTKFPELMAELDRCIAEKISSGECAKNISNMGGILVSRNAVLGAAWRQKKSFKCQIHSGGGSTKGKKRVRKRRLRNVQTRLGAKPRPRVVSEAEARAFDVMIQQTQRVGILGLTDHNCHWPVGTPGLPGFFFCGAESVDGLPYCEHHYSRSVIHNYQYRPNNISQSRGRFFLNSRGSY